MSVGGPTSPSALLVQRLEAALGTSLQQANVQTGARPDAVSQPPQADRQHTAQNDTQRSAREAVDRHRVQTDQAGRRDVGDARAARLAQVLGGETQTATTSSAPTRFGQAARLILALLALMPDRAPAATGRQPLLPSGPAQGNGRGAADTPVQGASTAAVPDAKLDGPEARRSQAVPGPEARSAEGAAQGQRGGEAVARAQSLQTLVQQGLMAGQLARALGQAVQTSGLFYESHLQDWVFGARTREQLAQEPQAQLGQRAAPGHTAPGPAAASPQVPVGQGTSAAMANAPAQTSAAMPMPTTLPAVPQPLPGIDAQAHALVRQQLDVLANQAFQWRGEVWPGATMDWEIQRRDEQPHDGTGSASLPEHWSTSLRLQLGRLGDVYARLGLSGGELVLHLAAPQSAPALQAELHALRERLQGHALTLVQVSVSDQAPVMSDEGAS